MTATIPRSRIEQHLADKATKYRLLFWLMLYLSFMTLFITFAIVLGLGLAVALGSAASPLFYPLIIVPAVISIATGWTASRSLDQLQDAKFDLRVLHHGIR